MEGPTEEAVLVVLQWKFDPAGYFEGESRITAGSHEIVLSNGKAEARIPQHIYDADPVRMRRALNEAGFVELFIPGRWLGLRMGTTWFAGAA